jgi:lipoprotein-releasing system permease protein
MFEFKIAFKYLLFKKRRLSSSIISLLSILIISIVVWLVLVFLSVTDGIEKNWLDKLTSLNAPIRIAPSDEYYSSYYYQIDTISSSSNYTPKSIKEKFNSRVSDPYDVCIDMELPYSFSKPIYDEKGFVDPIKKLYSILEEKKLIFQDYEISAALTRLTLNRTKKDDFLGYKDEKTSFLTQMSYLLTLTENNPNLKSLIMQPDEKDLDNIISKMDKTFDVQKDISIYPKIVDEKIFSQKIKSFFNSINLELIELNKGYKLKIENINFQKPIQALALMQNKNISLLILNANLDEYPNFIEGKLHKDKDNIYFSYNNEKHLISNDISIHLGKNKILNANLKNLNDAKSFDDIKVEILDFSKDKMLSGTIPFKDVKIKKVKINDFKSPFLYNFEDNKISLASIDNKTKVLLPKTYQSNGVLIGDFGYLSYSTMTLNSNQELRIPIYVAGFYDPGVLPIGNKCIIVPPEITRTINVTNNIYSFDGTPTNGIYVWIKDIKKAKNVKNELIKELQKEKIDHFFNITTYNEYEFSRDLMQQFQSDRTLFTIIAIIILTAACSNIISMLVLLVNDKKREIAILRAMGASSKSISFIFGFCGFILGLISSTIGTLAAVFTLKNLDVVINLLSKIQGHNFFNTTFFGNKLPNDLSFDALIFVIILTPLLALVAGLIPAIKASKTNPSANLRT